jgi:fructokinase
VRIGVDLGGTKIEAVALGGGGDVLARQRVATPPSYDGTLDAIVRLVNGVEKEVGARGTVGVGVPGVVVPATGLVKNANSTWLIGQPLERDLSRLLDRPIRTMNDANCFALSEAADGAGAGAGVVFGVILGTGVGGGIVVDGRCLVGPNLVAGEWGHNPLPWMTADEFPGPACYCGKVGCIESFLSGPGFERDHAQRSGRSERSRDIVTAASLGDEDASRSIARYHDRLARALASVINLLDPDVVVLGGGMSNLPGLAAAVASLLPRHVFSDSVETRIVLNAHGDSSGVRGAAWLWPA